MMDFTRIFAISASGMSLERLRLEVASTNIANAHASEGSIKNPYTPRRVIASTAPDFERVLDGSQIGAESLSGVGRVQVQTVDASPRLEYDPGNPAADEKGFVSISPVNAVEEMVTVLSSVRAYEANVRALNAGKAMLSRALEIGSSR
ncbi:flagellar basal body rod protein FlgC [Nevskia soli]|uniref:flagellar basal body rod protein FlgC n=1 Tax=Nevskia soli TaxID=418856 RepID=UPI0009FE4AEC|nr:flagellar basal body rod protein FlgC [Nevskia soli]